ncbi:uncharacterized protein LOC119720011 [Patiria miniata]|uniref:Uncharacterized protein n=1 Tax=Patiria miniata TaxID=46514 RepID=A0A913Z390_PATMI|nr:uncharacterized protein LOC119720011 [Patiria miniata]
MTCTENHDGVGWKHLEGVQRQLRDLGQHLRSIKLQQDGGENMEKQTLCVTAIGHKSRRLPGKNRVVSTKRRKNTRSIQQPITVNVKLVYYPVVLTNSPVNLGDSSGHNYSYGSCDCENQDTALTLQLARALAALEDAANFYVRSRKATIQIFCGLATELQKHLHCAKMCAKVIEGLVGTVASTGFGRFVASFFAPGTSVEELIGVVPGFGVGHGLSTVGEIITDIITSKLTSASAIEILEDDSIAFDYLKAVLERVHSTWKRLRGVRRVVTGVGAGVGEMQNSPVTDSVYALMRAMGTVAFQVGQVAGKTAFKAARDVGHRIVMKGVMSTASSTPQDLCTIITSVITLLYKTVPEMARVIREIAIDMMDLDWPSAQEMREKVDSIASYLEHFVNI